MAEFHLDEEQCEMIYLALRGDKNLSTLQKTKKLLELQKLHHAVLEVQGDLRLLEGSGVERPGLLRIFNPQHDMLADGSEKPTAKGRDTTRDMFADASGSASEHAAREVGGVSDDAEATGAAVPIVWGDDVPQPRPETGALIVQPAGHATSIADVIGFDGERRAFRVVDVDGWDGFVFAYGHRDQSQWRLLTQALEYADASDPAAAPLGSPWAIAAYLRSEAETLLGTDEGAPPDAYGKLVDAYLPLLRAIGNPAISPEYLVAHVVDELAGQTDNVHALARLLIQYAEVGESQAAHEDVDASLRAAIANEGDDDGADSNAVTFPTPSENWGEVVDMGIIGGDVRDEQDLAEGIVPVGASDPDDARASESDSPDAGESENGVGARTVSRQRKRNAALAGVTRTDNPNPRPKAVGKAARKAGAKKGKQ